MNLAKFIQAAQSHAGKRLLAIRCSLRPRSYWRQFQQLEIGSGPTKRAGWLTLDYCVGPDVVWDLCRALPFPDDCFERIYSSHVLEHFEPRKLRFLLSELHRVLKPGGKMLVCIPDASAFVEAYLENNPRGLLNYEPAVVSNCRMDILNYIFYMDGLHHFMFDMENLKWQLEQAGFKDASPRDFDSGIDAEDRRHGSLYATCSK